MEKIKILVVSNVIIFFILIIIKIQKKMEWDKMKKEIILIVSFVMVMVLGMGSKAEEVNKGVPGVREEVGAEGEKIITINLAEIDESKLPEKCEAEVILEAPIVTSAMVDKKHGKHYQGHMFQARQEGNVQVT